MNEALFFTRLRVCLAAVVLVAVAGCVSEPKAPAADKRMATGTVQRPPVVAQPPQPTVPSAQTAVPAAPQATDDAVEEHLPAVAEVGDEHAKGTRKGHWQAALWADVPGWAQDDAAEAWQPFLYSCRALVAQKAWRAICKAALSVKKQPDEAAARAFFEHHLQPWRVVAGDSLVTGYYEPLIEASRTRGGEYKWPIYAPPRDLVRVDLAEAVPEIRAFRLRGRIVQDPSSASGRKIVPYWSRKEIRQMGSAVPASVILWAKDPIDVFFLQVQGSGQAQLPNGERIRVAFAEHNGHPYRSIGKWLVQNGELTMAQASMQGIKDWVRAHPQRLNELLDINPAFVFFKLLPTNGLGPEGALSVPLTPGRSIAVDRQFVPLGAPMFLATTYPNAPNSPLQRLVMAQDTGTAIVGAARVDLFWGFGDEAGQHAGRMKQNGQVWVLWPKGEKPPVR